MRSDPRQQHGIATKLLSSTKGCAIDGQKIFEQHAKLWKCQCSGFLRIPPLDRRKPAMTTSESEPPRLFHADRKGLPRLPAVAPANKKICRNFVKPAEQRHSRQQHSIGIDIAALRRK